MAINSTVPAKNAFITCMKYFEYNLINWYRECKLDT